MKTIALAVFGLLSSLLGVLLVQEKAQTRQLTARLAESETRIHQQRTEMETQTQAVAKLEEEKTRLAAKAESTKQKLIAARESLSAAGAGQAAPPAMGASQEADEATARADAKAKSGGGGGIKGYLGKMMADPAMKKMIRSSQGMAMKQMYGELVKQWALSPEETNNFYEMLMDRQMATMEKGAKAMNGGADATASAPAEDPDAALKSSLGDKMYQQYKDYERTVGDRAVISEIQQHLAADSATALSADQSKFLLNAMSEERQIQASANPSASGQPNGGYKRDGTTSIDQKYIDNFLKRQSDFNARVAQRATGVLTAQQLDSLKAYQTQMLDMQKMGMEMAQKMGGDKP